MKLYSSTHWLERFRGMFNLNDPHWGRADEKPTEDDKPPQVPTPAAPETPPESGNDRAQGVALNKARLIWMNSGVISTASWAACWGG